MLRALILGLFQLVEELGGVPRLPRDKCAVVGLGFRAWGLGFRVQGLGFRVQGLGFSVWVQGSGFRV